MADFFRTGRPIAARPDRYRAAIERLTRQDIAVFFQEALAALPQLVADLARGGRVVDVHCGGGRWLVAMARRFPDLELVGVEFEADSVARARATIEAEGLTDRITIREAEATEPGTKGRVRPGLLPVRPPPAARRPGRPAPRRGPRCDPAGRLLVLDWPLPSEPDEFRTRHGELIAGVQLDELFQGTALATREQFLAWFADAGLPEPDGHRPAVRGGGVRPGAPRLTRSPYPTDAATSRRLLLHEAAVHAVPGRQLDDLGDGLLLLDPVDPEPFWNRLEALRWPTDPDAFDRRLTEIRAALRRGWPASRTCGSRRPTTSRPTWPTGSRPTASRTPARGC